MVWGGLLCEVICDAIDMEVNKGLLAFLAEEEGAVGGEAVAGEVGLGGGVEGGGAVIAEGLFAQA